VHTRVARLHKERDGAVQYRGKVIATASLTRAGRGRYGRIHA